MNEIETFLEEVAAERRTQQARLRAAFPVPSPVELPPELELTLRHGLSLCPVACATLRPPDRAILATPSSDREQVAWWWARRQRLSPNLNWGVATERQGIAVLEVDTRQAIASLQDLTNEDDAWERTLRVEARWIWFSLFRYDGEPVRRLAGQYPGFMLHRRAVIVVPPSTVDYYGRLLYADPSAPLLNLPRWLMESNNAAEDEYSY